MKMHTLLMFIVIGLFMCSPAYTKEDKQDKSAKKVKADDGMEKLDIRCRGIDGPEGAKSTSEINLNYVARKQGDFNILGRVTAKLKNFKVNKGKEKAATKFINTTLWPSPAVYYKGSKSILTWNGTGTITYIDKKGKLQDLAKVLIKAEYGRRIKKEPKLSKEARDVARADKKQKEKQAKEEKKLRDKEAKKAA